MGNTRRDREGATALEFALLIPVFLVVLFAVFEWGWFMSRMAIVQHAAQEAGRAVAGMPDTATDAELETQATSASGAALGGSGLDIADFTVSVNTAPANAVDVSLTFNGSYAGMTGLVPMPADLSATYSAAR